MMSLNVSIFGATGSIGTQAIDIIMQHPDMYNITVLSAQSQYESLAKLALKTNPDIVVIGNTRYETALKELLNHTNITVLSGPKGLLKAAQCPVDKYIAAIVGIAGLEPLLEACKHGGDILLANKESLVIGGDILLRHAALYGNNIIPIDSEHNALFQALQGNHIKNVASMTLTASGGPFFTMPKHDMKHITKKQAINHPKWSMGPKISVDSATMANKALELIEAHYLFTIPHRHINIVIHPQSIVHSLVEFCDKSSLAQLSVPDMRIAIAYALSHPHRITNNLSESLNLASYKNLEFFEPDMDKFPFIYYAKELLHHQPYPLIFNVTNDIAVEYFLHDAISFMDIMTIVHHNLNSITIDIPNSIDDIYAAIDDVSRLTHHYIKGRL